MKKITMIVLIGMSFNALAMTLAPVNPESVKAPRPTLQPVPAHSVKTPSFSLSVVDTTKVSTILPKLKPVDDKDMKSGNAKLGLGLEPAHKDLESVSKAEKNSWRFNPWR